MKKMTGQGMMSDIPGEMTDEELAAQMSGALGMAPGMEGMAGELMQEGPMSMKTSNPAPLAGVRPGAAGPSDTWKRFAG